MKKIKVIRVDDDVKTDFANWLDRLSKENGQDKTWSERYEDLFRKSNGNNNYLVGQNKDRNWLMRRKTREEVAGMIKAIEESTSNSRANRRQEARAGAEEVAHSGRWTVYRIKTPQASVHYGAHTRWCIAGNGIDQDSSTRESKRYASEYWRSQTHGYSKVFYYIRNDDNKFALLWENSRKFQLWDALDNKIIQSSGYITFEAGALNEIKMFCYTVPKNPQTDNFDFKEMFNEIISRGSEALRTELTSYNREAADGQFVDFTDEDFNDPNFNQLVCDTIPTTSNIDILLSRMRRTNAPLIKMKITCNTTNAIRDSLKTNNKIDLYNGGFKLKSENKSFRAVKDRFKKLAEMNADPNSGLKILSIGYLVSFAPALRFIPYNGNDNAQFIIEDQNQINTLLNNFSRYEDHALYDLFSVGINDVLTNSLRYINNYFNSHQDMSTNDYNKMLGKLNEYLQYYIRMSVKANRSQLGFALPIASINVIDEAALNKIIESFELSTDQSNDLHTILSDATNTARISRDIQRNVQTIENDTNVDQVEVNQMGGVNTADVEHQLSIDEVEENQNNTTPEQENESTQTNTVQENVEENEESDTWPNGVPKVILGKEISQSEASSLGPLTPEQREGAVLFDIIAGRENKEITQEEYEKIKVGNAALGNSLEHLHNKMNEYGITLIEETNQELSGDEDISDEYIRNVMTEVKNALDDLSSSYSFGYNVDFDDKFYDVEFDHNSSGFRIQVKEDGNIEILRDTDGRGNLTQIYEYNTRDTSCQEIVSEVFNNLYDDEDNENEEENRSTHSEQQNTSSEIVRTNMNIVDETVNALATEYSYDVVLDGLEDYLKADLFNNQNLEMVIYVSNENGAVHIEFMKDGVQAIDVAPEDVTKEVIENYIKVFFGNSQSEQTQETNQDVPKERYKFYIYGIDQNNQYKILDVTGADEYIVNNSTDNIDNCNTQAIQVANNIYNELKSNNFDDLNLREVHYMKVVNTDGNKLIKIIR